MKIVVDTNVLVSAFLSQQAPPGLISRLIIQRRLEVCYDLRILTEYAQVLARPKFKFHPEAIQAQLDFIREFGQDIIPAPLPLCLPDRSDEKFLEVAVASRARFLITGNLRHYPSDMRLGINVVSPRQFLEGTRQ